MLNSTSSNSGGAWVHEVRVASAVGPPPEKPAKDLLYNEDKAGSPWIDVGSIGASVRSSRSQEGWSPQSRGRDEALTPTAEPCSTSVPHATWNLAGVRMAIFPRGLKAGLRLGRQIDKVSLQEVPLGARVVDCLSGWLRCSLLPGFEHMARRRTLLPDCGVGDPPKKI